MKILFAIMLLVVQTGAWSAPMDTFKFESVEQEKIFKKLSHELRCLVCQNQSISDSNADLAKDLRTEIYGMLQDGKTEEQIKEFMVARYGDYVLYKPPFKPMTWLLWFAPMVIFLMGIFYARYFISRQDESPEEGELSDEDVERLKKLQMELNKKDDDKNNMSAGK